MWLTNGSYLNKSGTVCGPPYTGGPGQTAPVAPPVSSTGYHCRTYTVEHAKQVVACSFTQSLLCHHFQTHPWTGQLYQVPPSHTIKCQICARRSSQYCISITLSAPTFHLVIFNHVLQLATHKLKCASLARTYKLFSQSNLDFYLANHTQQSSIFAANATCLTFWKGGTICVHIYFTGHLTVNSLHFLYIYPKLIRGTSSDHIKLRLCSITARLRIVVRNRTSLSHSMQGPTMLM